MSLTYHARPPSKSHTNVACCAARPMYACAVSQAKAGASAASRWRACALWCAAARMHEHDLTSCSPSSPTTLPERSASCATHDWCPNSTAGAEGGPGLQTGSCSRNSHDNVCRTWPPLSTMAAWRTLPHTRTHTHTHAHTHTHTQFDCFNTNRSLPARGPRMQHQFSARPAHLPRAHSSHGGRAPATPAARSWRASRWHCVDTHTHTLYIHTRGRNTVHTQR
jgi:hypothetical protein